MGSYSSRNGGEITMDTLLGGKVYHGGYAAVNIRLMWTMDSPDGDTFRADVEGPAGGRFSGFTLTDSTGAALSSDALPSSVNLSDWDGGFFTFIQPWGTRIEGTISGLRSVPDAANTGALLTFALLAIFLVRTVSKDSHYALLHPLNKSRAALFGEERRRKIHAVSPPTYSSKMAAAKEVGLLTQGIRPLSDVEVPSKRKRILLSRRRGQRPFFVRDWRGSAEAWRCSGSFPHRKSRKTL